MPTSLTAPLLTDRLANALAFANTIHARQIRKGSEAKPIPYMAHILGVAAIALEHGADENEAMAAVLHDCVEDAPADLGGPAAAKATIELRFGRAVLDIVMDCTDALVSPKPPWIDRKLAYVAHVADLGASSLLVSASDKLHNARAILADYRVLGDEVWQRFNTGAGPVRTIGYYHGLADAYARSPHHPELIGALRDVVAAIEAETGVQGHWPPRG